MIGFVLSKRFVGAFDITFKYIVFKSLSLKPMNIILYGFILMLHHFYHHSLPFYWCSDGIVLLYVQSFVKKSDF